MPNKSLLMRLFLPYLWITVVAVIAVGWYGSHVMRQFYLDRTAEDLEALARLCSMEMAKDLSGGESDAIKALCDRWGMTLNTRITVILPSGKVIGDSDEDPQLMDNHLQRPEIQEAFAGAVGRSTRYSTTLKEGRMYVAVAASGNGSPAAVVRTSIPVTAVNEELAKIQEKIIVTCLLATGLIACVSLWLSLRVARSLASVSPSVEEEPV